MTDPHAFIRRINGKMLPVSYRDGPLPEPDEAQRAYEQLPQDVRDAQLRRWAALRDAPFRS